MPEQDFNHSDIEDVQEIPISSLAYLGDAVYELAVRDRILHSQAGQAHGLFRLSLHYVEAGAQAEAMDFLYPQLTADEQALCRRARNHVPNSRPRKQDPLAYRKATALEALCAWLYLQEEEDRLAQLLHLCFTCLEAYRPQVPLADEENTSLN